MASVVGERIDEVMAWIRQGKSFRQVATHLGVDESAVRRFFKRNPDLADEVRAIRGGTPSSDRMPDSDIPPSSIGENEATITYRHTGSGTDIKTPEEVLADHGLKPGEWNYTVDARSWDAAIGDGVVTTMHYFKIIAHRKPESRYAFEVPKGWTPPKARKTRPKRGGVQTIALFADPHFPLHEPDLIEASVAWLEEFQPDRIVCLGDEGDWAPFKRHRPNPRTDRSVSESLMSVYEGLARWRNAAPDAEMDLIPGNHTMWLEQRILEMIPQAAELIRPGDDEPWVSMRSLLKLDELRIKYHGTRGEYHDAVIEIAPGLVLMHGTKTGKHGGATKEQEGWEGASIVQGHDHALALTAINRRTPNGGHSQRYAISGGAMARRDLGYSPKQDVGQGWTVITLHEDGRWHPDLAVYDPQLGDVTWRDWRYCP